MHKPAVADGSLVDVSAVAGDGGLRAEEGVLHLSISDVNALDPFD